MIKEKSEIQRILDIALEFYTPGSIGFCSCLTLARDQNLITKEERIQAEWEIMKYIDLLSPEGHQAFLKYALEDADLPNEFEDMLAIYEDWENRPKPWIKKS